MGLTKWLIEREAGGVIFYYAGNRGSRQTAYWERDATMANWYYTQEFAKSVIKKARLIDARATEHEFVDQQPVKKP